MFFLRPSSLRAIDTVPAGSLPSFDSSIGFRDMRLWSLHPKYLDPQGLVALWREALLARAVLRGETRGYRHHPQLQRFRSHPQPRLAINAYLTAVHAEATQRGYRFDHSKLGAVRAVEPIAVGSGQLAHEWIHLQGKLSARSPAVHARWTSVVTPACHPLFRRRAGPVAPWERPWPTAAGESGSGMFHHGRLERA